MKDVTMNKINFNDEQINQIIKLYTLPNIGLEYISKEMRVSRKVIKRILLERNIPIKSTSSICRKYNVNEKFLDVLCKEQAYFLGWIASDGCVGKNNEITLSLQDRDNDIMHKIKKLTNWDGPIKFIKRYENEVKLFKTVRNRYGISIANQCLANKLRNLGYNNNKTYNLLFPHFLNKDLLHHFLRSFIEGDGSIIFSHNNAQVNFVSTNEFCIEFKKFAQEFLNIKVFLDSIEYEDKSKSSKHSRASIGGNYQCLKFLNYLYQDAFLYMDRKFNYFKNIVKILSNNSNCHNKTKKQLEISRRIIQSIESQKQIKNPQNIST